MDWGVSLVRPTGHFPALRRPTGVCLQLNLNQQFTASVTYDLPFGKGKQFGSPVGAALSTLSPETGKWISLSAFLLVFQLFIVNSNNQSGVFFHRNGSNQNRPDRGDPTG